MAKLQSTKDLAHYALRNLGGGINDIEVTEDQMNDRITEAMDFFLDRHYDGVDEIWFAHQVTLDDVKQGTIQLPPTIKAVLDVQCNVADGIQYSPYGVSVPGIGVVSSTLQPADMAYGTGSGYGNMTGYYVAKGYIELMNDLLRPEPWVSFNAKSGKLGLLGQSMSVGSVYMIHAYRDLDIDENVNVYNDKFVKAYTTALIKRQWGANLKKYKGVELPGGVTIDGQSIYDEAVNEIEKLENDFEERYELSASLMIG